MKTVFSPKCLEYRFPGHPESPERVETAYLALKEGGKRQGYDFIEPGPCTEQDILRVHSRELLESVRSGSFHDPDTPNIPGIFEYAKLSAGGAIKAAEISLSGEKAFSLMRPPGHHAGHNNVRGFCYFNNMAIAVARFLDRMKTVAVIDFDVHYGDGSAAIFRGNEKVLYISLHQSPLYPGVKEIESGHHKSYALEPGTGEKEYLSKFRQALRDVQEFGARHVAVSAGFDGSEKETLAGMMLKETTYRKMGEMISALGLPCFAVLEGGYADLAACAVEFLGGWSGK